MNGLNNDKNGINGDNNNESLKWINGKW